jgi:non-homologous end joining protein Ku
MGKLVESIDIISKKIADIDPDIPSERYNEDIDQVVKALTSIRDEISRINDTSQKNLLDIYDVKEALKQTLLGIK